MLSVLISDLSGEVLHEGRFATDDELSVWVQGVMDSDDDAAVVVVQKDRQ